MKKNFTFILMWLLCVFSIPAKAQTQFWSETFETNPSSGTRTPQGSGGIGTPATSYFKLTDGSTVSQVVAFTGKEGGNYWAGEDHNIAGTTLPSAGAGTDDILNELKIDWTGIDITGKTGLSFKGLFAANSTSQAWDNINACLSGVATTNTDYIIVEYQIDGGTWTSLIRFFNKGSASGPGLTWKNLYEDTDNNGCGDGTMLSNSFGEFEKTISGTGSTMNLRIRVYSEGNNEEWGIDNFRLFATPPLTVTTTTTIPANIGSKTATLGGNVISGGTTPITERGIVWSTAATSTTPTVSNNKVVMTLGTGTGVFSGLVNSLPLGTQIYFRAYVTNGVDTSYGTALTFTTSAALSAIQSQTNVSCNGGGNGTATAIAAGGKTPYTYSWSPSGGTAATATGLSVQEYTITITDAEATTITKTYNIVQPAAILTATSSTTPVSCNGGGNGTATVTPAGGTVGYTYLWNNMQTTQTVTGLAAGIYSVEVTDANGCSITLNNIEITQPDDLTASTAPVNVSCNDQSNGSITVTPSGGTGPYTYLWNNTQTGQTATNLTAGLYNVVVTDFNSCSILIENILVTQPSVILSNPTQSNVSCVNGANGSAEVAPTGGAGNYTYLWSPSGETTSSISGLSAGNYNVTITDLNGCEKIEYFTISEPTAIVLTQGTSNNVSCKGGANGSVSVVANGGAGFYTYSWSPNGATTSTITGLTSGDYTVTVTDVNSCQAIQTYTVSEPTAALTVADQSQTNILCSGSATGSASVVATGGTGTYTYSWSPSGGTASTATGLTAGTYTVTITDANACEATATFTITQPVAPLMANAVSALNIACYGDATGEATITASGGTGAYTYSWAPSGGTAATATGLIAGTYTVTVTDENLCTATETFTITQPNAPLSATSSSTMISCFGGSNGTAGVAVSGGTLPYSYSWAPLGGTGSSISGRPAGDYTVTITDGNNCTLQTTVTIATPAQFSATVDKTDVSCYLGANGSATITPSGATAPFTYTWTPYGGSNAYATGLAAGTYVVVVQDANTCQYSVSVTIDQPDELTAASSQVNVKCPGQNNGEATVTPSGGTAPYSYSWSPYGGTAATATGLAPGMYNVEITDARGCFITRSFTILPGTDNQPPVPNVSTLPNVTGYCSIPLSEITIPTALDNCVGTIVAGTVSSLNFNAPGTYPVTWVYDDGNGNYTVQNQTFIVLNTTINEETINHVTCNGLSNGSITVSQSGGTGPYTYSWFPSGGTAATATGLSAGEHTVTVTNASGCIAIRTFTINQPSALSATTSKTDVLCNGGSTGSATVSVTGGTAPYTYLWSPSGGTAATATGLSAGDYIVTVTDANGCTLTRSFTIDQPTSLTFTTTSLEKYDYDINYTQTIVVSGGTGNKTFAVKTGSLPTDFTLSQTGVISGKSTQVPDSNFTITATDANNCTAEYNFDLKLRQIPVTITANASQSKVYGENNLALTFTASRDLLAGDSFTGTLERAPGEDVGSYKITQGTLSAGDKYLIIYEGANFSITQKPVTVTANPSQSKVYGTANPVYTYSVEPALVNGDSFTGVLTRAAGENAGTYAINQGTLALDANYKLTYVSNNFTISKADQTITWNQALGFGCEGETSIILTATSSNGLPVSYSSSNTNLVSVSGNSLNLLNYGSVTISASQLGNNNYNPAPVVSLPLVNSQPNLIRKQFENIIFFDNSSKSFQSYVWYKNGALVPGQTEQYFKENGPLNGTYYAMATKLDGIVVTTCPLVLSPTIVDEDIKIVPNPVKPNASYELINNVPSARIQNARIEVYSVGGLLLESKTISENTVTLKAPTVDGIYIIKMTLSNGKYFTKNLLVKN